MNGTWARIARKVAPAAGVRATAVLAIAIAMEAASLPASESLPAGSGPLPCISPLEESSLGGLIAAPSSPQAAGPAGDPKSHEERRRLISELEISELITLMKMAGHPDDGETPRARTSPERLRQVLDEVTALIVAIHAKEAAGRLESVKVRNQKTRAWFDASYTKVEGCVAARFEGRGGAVAYRESVALVTKHRAALEEMLREHRRWVPGGTRPWPRPGSLPQ